MGAGSMSIPSGRSPTGIGRLVVFWAMCGALAGVAVTPYMLAMNPGLLARLPVALPVYVLAQFAQSLIVLSLVTWTGLRLGRPIGLGAPIVFPRSLPALTVTASAGGITGAALLMLDKALQPFMPSMPTLVSGGIDLWKRVLACFYGGITEELICRLFLMSLLVWLCYRIGSRTDAPPKPWMAWTGIIGASILFGLAHLPATASILPLTTVVIVRALLLNGIGGIVFGWIYWRQGLGYAMTAHFFADLVLHVVGGT
jgi:membrane protease YdiL (CAAX protease family)